MSSEKSSIVYTALLPKRKNNQKTERTYKSELNFFYTSTIADFLDKKTYLEIQKNLEAQENSNTKSYCRLM